MAMSVGPPESLKDKQQHQDGIFYEEIIIGLRMTPEQIISKYFCDLTVDRLFREIVTSREYYLRTSDLEILKNQTKTVVSRITGNFNEFELMELWLGDWSKSFFLLKEVPGQVIDRVYNPLEISENIAGDIMNLLTKKLPDVSVSQQN